MRFCYLTTAYPSYLDFLYQSKPGMPMEPFAVQHAAMLNDGFAWHGAWSATLPKYGYEVKEIIANALPMQLCWARESGYRVPAADAVPAIALRQVKEWNPEVILIDDPVTFTAKFVEQLRCICPRLRMVLGFSGSPSYIMEALRSYDVLLNPTRSMVLKYQGMGCCARYFPHAFNANILRQLPERHPVEEAVIFVGGLIRAAGFHSKREELLEAVVQALPMRLYSPQAGMSLGRDALSTSFRRGVYHAVQLMRSAGVSTQALARIPVVGRASKWKEVPIRRLNPILQPRLQPALFGRDFYAIQRKHAVTLNVHGDIAGNEAANMRLFEATGVGTCLLTDAKSNLGDFFEVDREVIAFTSAGECVEKARWLLEHRKEREAIAQAGQLRTLRDHTFHQRASDLNAIIQEFLGNGTSTSVSSPATGTGRTSL